MNKSSIDTARDADLRLSRQALQRAAQRAQHVARQTGTAIVVSRQGVVEKLLPEAAATGVQEPDAPYGDAP